MLRRLGVACLLLALLVPLPIAAGVLTESRVTQQDVVADYESSVGSETRFWGRVVHSDPVTVELTATPSLRVRLEGIESAPPVGTRLVFYGTVEDGHVVSVSEYVIHHPTKRRVALVTSALAYPLVLFLWFRYWSVDRDDVAFVVRESR